MKSLSMIVLFSSLSVAVSAYAQTSTPSQSNANTAQSTPSSSSANNTCVGPVSYCNVYFGGS
jgi:hypothetical protein